MTLAIALATLALAGCNCSDKGEQAPAAQAPAQEQQAQQQPTAEPERKEPTEEERRVLRMREALAAQGIEVELDETLPTRLGNRDECRPIERRRYNFPGELVYVIVGTYPTQEEAQACIDAYAAFLGNQWPTYQNDFYRHGRYVIELNPPNDADLKKRAKAAVEIALD